MSPQRRSALPRIRMLRRVGRHPQGLGPPTQVPGRCQVAGWLWLALGWACFSDFGWIWFDFGLDLVWISVGFGLGWIWFALAWIWFDLALISV